MKIKLREIAEYVNIKINSNNLSLNNYISTENMLPDRKGISISSNIPNNNVNKFLKMIEVKSWNPKLSGGK